MPKKLLKQSALLVCCFYLTGCVHYEWMRPGATQLDYSQDNYACQQSALASAPPVYQVSQPNNGIVPHEDIRTTCFTQGGVTNCDKHITQSPQAAPVTTDINQGNRNQLQNSCMQAHGWVLTPVDSDTGQIMR